MDGGFVIAAATSELHVAALALARHPTRRP
jgi:hypothetical protein